MHLPVPKMTKFLIVCFLPLISSSYYNSDVLDLTALDLMDFHTEIVRHDTVLLQFYAPWCKFCRRLEPEYERAATILRQHELPVVLAKVDCTSNLGGKDICKIFRIASYPTLKIFKRGQFVQEYEGARVADGIIAYMVSL